MSPKSYDVRIGRIHHGIKVKVVLSFQRIFLISSRVTDKI